VAIANRGQRLHAEKEAIKKPTSASATGDTVLLETVKRGEKKDLVRRKDWRQTQRTAATLNRGASDRHHATARRLSRL